MNELPFADRIRVLLLKDDFMKRLISLILVFSMLFALASCSKLNTVEITYESETTTTTLPPPDVKKSKHHKKFKDEKGRVVFTVDVVLPELSQNGEQRILDYINGVTTEVFEEACKFAENNIKNASNHIDRGGKPWSTEITFEPTYLSGRFVCFIIKNSFSVDGDHSNPTYSTKCFDVEKGKPCTPLYFAIDPANELEALDHIIGIIQERTPYEFYPEGGAFSPQQVELLRSEFRPENFYITENGMGFYYVRYTFDPSMDGMYQIELSWEELLPFFYDIYSV